MKKHRRKLLFRARFVKQAANSDGKQSKPIYRSHKNKIVKLLSLLTERYKNKSEIFQGFKYHVQSDGPDHTLVINKLCMDDEAKYTCKINEIETYAHLTITR